jgi:hypothetical protein
VLLALKERRAGFLDIARPGVYAVDWLPANMDSSLSCVHDCGARVRRK